MIYWLNIGEDAGLLLLNIRAKQAGLSCDRPDLWGAHHGGQDVHGHGEDDGAVVLGRDAVESLQVP